MGNSNSGQVILSAEEQPLLSGATEKSSTQQRAPRKSRKRRREEEDQESVDGDDPFTRDAKVSIDLSDDDEETVGLDKDGYDRATFVNAQEKLPNTDEFGEWLAFSKKL